MEAVAEREAVGAVEKPKVLFDHPWLYAGTLYLPANQSVTVITLEAPTISKYGSSYNTMLTLSYFNIERDDMVFFDFYIGDERVLSDICPIAFPSFDKNVEPFFFRIHAEERARIVANNRASEDKTLQFRFYFRPDVDDGKYIRPRVWADKTTIPPTDTVIVATLSPAMGKRTVIYKWAFSRNSNVQLMVIKEGRPLLPEVLLLGALPGLDNPMQVFFVCDEGEDMRLVLSNLSDTSQDVCYLILGYETDVTEPAVVSPEVEYILPPEQFLIVPGGGGGE